jgi:hypothetical protein
MPNKHKNGLIGFNPDDPTLKERLEALAARLGITRKKVLETAVTEYLDRHEPAPKPGTPASPSTED